MKRRVLIIDNEKKVINSLSKFLSGKGLLVEFSMEASEGLRKFKSGNYYIVICDMQIKDLHPLDFLKKALYHNPDALIIFVSSLNDGEPAAAVIKNGAFDYFSKPINNEKILAAIDQGIKRIGPVLENYKLPDTFANKEVNFPKRVLVIDDEKSIRKTLKEILSFEGYEIDEAENGEEGLRKFISKKNTIVLCDIRMPKLDGLEFLERALKYDSSAIVIMISGHGNVDTAVEAVRKGAFDYISKPPDLNRLLITVRNGFDQMKIVSEEIEFKSEEYIGLTSDGEKIRTVRLTSEGEFRFLDEKENLHNIIYTSPLESMLLKRAIEEFEYLINKKDVKESELHRFFEKNPDFILSEDYKSAHSKIVLTGEEDNNLIPDFVLEPFGNRELCDLLEIKLPGTNILSFKKNRNRFSSSVLEACAQLRQYADFFDEKENRNRIRNKYGLSLYKPSMIVVIGRAVNLDPYELRRIHSDLPQLTLKTYDQILDKMKRSR